LSDAAGPCSDNFGFTDTFASNSANGKWSVAEKDAGNDEGLAEPNAAGDKMVMTIPKAGLVDSNSSGSSCKITVAPTAAATVTGTYNDGGTFTITGATIPLSTSGCPVSPTSATFSATYTLSPAIFDMG
jgi:hypothetical protein